MLSARGLAGAWRERLEAAPPERRLGRDAYLSLLIHFLFQFGASMAGIFLTLYLWRMTESLWVNGMYHIIAFAATLTGFLFGGGAAKRKDRLYVYRAGLLLTALFYMSVLFAEGRVAEWYVLFAVFSGLASAFYWTGYLVLMHDVSRDDNRIHYLAVNTIAFTSAGMIGPALAGRIISSNDGLAGYSLVFGIASALFILAALASFKIGALPSKRSAYYLKLSIQVMKRERQWAKGLAALFFMGALNGLMLFLPNLLLYQVLPREEWIGYLGMVFSGAMIAVSALISKYAKERSATAYLTASAVGFVAGASLLFLRLNAATVIGFLTVYSLMVPLQANAFNALYYKQIGRLPPKGQFRVESVVLREVALNAGRIASIAALISFADGFGGDGLAWVLFAGAATQLLLPFLAREPANRPRVRAYRRIAK